MRSSLEPGTIIEVAVQAVAHGGDGVGRVAGIVCFVMGALPGDVVRVRIYRRGRQAVWGRLLDVVSPSPHRMAESVCTRAACASTCVWHAFSYPAQAEWKRRIVAETLARLGGITAEVAWREAPEMRLGYRTRATFHGDGRQLGYYAHRTHDVIPLTSCPLHHPHLNDAVEVLSPLGVKRDVSVTVNPEGPEKMVWMRNPDEGIREKFPLTNTVKDVERFHFVFDGVPIVNGVFSQSGLLLNRLLRSETDMCIGRSASLLDLYCGNGNLSLHHAARIEVVGMDHAGPAVKAADALGKGNYRRGGEAAMTALISERAWGTILLDPPRTGAAPLVDALANARADAIVYVSCNPATLARDLRRLCRMDWRLIRTVAIDMFPYTPHVESVCMLRRQ